MAQQTHTATGPSMTDEQQRVKNLLVDTVILLCKNSLRFNHELCIEGLLGVKVDKHDVFFLHISETFKGSAGTSEIVSVSPAGQQPTGDLESGTTADDKHADGVIHSSPGREEYPGGVPELKEEHPKNREVKSELSATGSGCEFGGQQPGRQYDGSVRVVAPLVTGQRRVPRKASSPHRNWTAVSCTTDSLLLDSSFLSDSDCLSSSECSSETQNVIASSESAKAQCEESGGNSNSNSNSESAAGYLNSSNPPYKLPQVDGARIENGVDAACSDYVGLDLKAGRGAWPSIVRQLELPTRPAPYVHVEAPLRTPAWPGSPLHNPVPPMDLLVSSPRFMLALGVDSHPVLTPPRYTPLVPARPLQPARRPWGPGGTAPRRRREWCGKWFNCDLCRYQTKRLWNLQRHMRKHAGPGPLLAGPLPPGPAPGGGARCPICGGDDDSAAGYVNEAELRRHLAEDHGETAAVQLYAARVEAAGLRLVEPGGTRHPQGLDMTLTDISLLKQVCADTHPAAIDGDGGEAAPAPCTVDTHPTPGSTGVPAQSPTHP